MNIGERYKLKEDMKFMCCNYNAFKDDVIVVYSYHSPKRINITIEGIRAGIHTVKASTLNRCGEKIQ